MATSPTARILIIAGSDSGGGAGIQADIKTVTMLGGHAMTAITAITAQNTLGVTAVHPIPTDIVLAQMQACFDDLGVDAVKIGMIGSAETSYAVADYLDQLSPRVPIVLDPVMVATSGAVLADADTIKAFDRLMAVSSVVTPNLDELQALADRMLSNEIEIGVAAEDLAQRHGIAVLATGARLMGGKIIADGQESSADGELFDILFVDEGLGVRETIWNSTEIDTPHTHGTGCTLASAIAVGLANGLPVPEAIAQARKFVRLAIFDAPGLGTGHGPMGHQAVREDAFLPGASLNQVTVGCSDYAASVDFYTRIGLRQIVDAPENGYARFEAANGVTFSIHEGGAPSDSQIVYFEHPRLFDWCKELETKGIIFEQQPRNEQWLWDEARLRDPHGNVVCLYRAGINRRYPPWRVA